MSIARKLECISADFKTLVCCLGQGCAAVFIPEGEIGSAGGRERRREGERKIGIERQRE